MSNIPPEPPDPPISVSQTPHNNQTSNQRNNRRGRGRGRGNGGRSERAPPDAAAIRQSSQPPQTLGTSEDARQREQKQHPTNASRPARIKRRHNLESVPGDKEARSAGLDSSPGAGRRYRALQGEEGREGDVISVVDQAGAATRNQGRSRRGQFGSQLTSQNNKGHPSFSRRPRSPPPNSDLTTRLTFAFRAGPPHPDCPICFNPLYPGQPTWSCSLSAEATSCCWSSFHLKCVREWAQKSTRETREAFVARGETREGEWRCPGCQTKRVKVPQLYLCFCGAVTNPKPGISTPHSCGLPCSRKRDSCYHPCPLSCHPGPCPTCVLTVDPSCHCTKTTLSMRCGHFHSQPPPSLSCGQACTHPLSCGAHVCERECHPGDCGSCERKEMIKCFCGKHSKQVDCGEGLKERVECFSVGPDGETMVWDGRFDCGTKCEQTFTCGLHSCSQTCHPPTAPTQCPFDPSVVINCPCGKKSLRELSEVSRTKCTDPIQTCASLCGKQLQDCSHCCSAPCHVGVCPPCNIPVAVPCRCGSTTRYVPCQQRQRDIAKGDEVVLCEKVCGALRLCGRHQCFRACCPLARLKTNKGKKRTATLVDPELDDAEKLWHECDLVCGKMLGCGTHKCQEADHRGPCPPCLRSSFDELTCHCARTVLFPPIPCGTRINCTHPCDRPPPPCGHDKTAHTCHEDPNPCPPCPFLTTKTCACGKSNITNVRCSQEKVSCGQSCGKLLDCGFHRCQKLCHADDCGGCTSVCGKPRKLCLPFHHLCTLPCHAPSACNESEPCDTMITISCTCGRFQQPVKCGRCISNPGKVVQQLHCRDECHIAKRNARLAEALGISSELKEKTTVTYSDELLLFGRANAKFVSLVEKTLNDFVTSDKKTQVLPYMPESRRKFVRDLCQLYRIDTQLVDQEPRRSVQLYRRIDSRTPSPLLSASITSQNTPNFGKLADLRTPQPRIPPTVAKPPTGSSSSRGWSSVVSPAPQSGSVNVTPSGVRGTSTAPTAPRKFPPPPAPGSSGASSNNVPENWEEE